MVKLTKLLKTCYLEFGENLLFKVSRKLFPGRQHTGDIALQNNRQGSVSVKHIHAES